MQQAVVCIARDQLEAEKIVEVLNSFGFSKDDISVQTPDASCAQELGFQKHSKAPEGISWGVATGAVIGAMLCYFSATGSITLPLYMLGSSSLLATVLNGLAIGALTGGAVGGLIGLTVPELEVVKYGRKVRYGSTLIAVHADSYSEVEEVFRAVKSAGCELVERVDEVLVRQKVKVSEPQLRVK